MSPLPPMTTIFMAVSSLRPSWRNHKAQQRRPRRATVNSRKPQLRPFAGSDFLRPSSAFFCLATQHGFEADSGANSIFDVVDEVRRCTSDEFLRTGIEAAPIRTEHLLHLCDRYRQGKPYRP